VFKQWDFDLAHQLFTSGPDPTRVITPRFHTKQIRREGFVNAMGYSNPELDRLFDREAALLDRSQRTAAWREAQLILMRDLPAIPLFEIPVVNAVSARFEAVIAGPYLAESREQTYEVAK
jgi:peptide/nickel transport system substrate-binding protein